MGKPDKNNRCKKYKYNLYKIKGTGKLIRYINHITCPFDSIWVDDPEGLTEYRYNFEDITVGEPVLVADARARWTRYYLENTHEDNKSSFEDSVLGRFLKRVDENLIKPYAKMIYESQPTYYYEGEVPVGFISEEQSEVGAEFSLAYFLGENISSLSKTSSAFKRTGEAVINSTDDIISNPKALYNKSAQEIADVFRKEGFEGMVEQSTKGSELAKIVRVKGHKINMIQVHPGGGRHGLPYIKAKGNGVNFKVIDGSPSDYIRNPTNEKEIFYWMGE